MPEALYTPNDLDQWLTSNLISKGAKVAVALSGGSDSLALTLMCALVRPTVALTVDHGLRDNSGEEAETVAQMMADHNIPHQILTWGGEKPDANIQAEARKARYRLLVEVCQREGIEYLLTAHHMEDQAETMLLRLARGSGLYGLSAMDSVNRDFYGSGITLVRPLLSVAKDSLRHYLVERNISWIEDPSNQNDAFDRVKIRKFLEEAPLGGINVRRMAETSERMRRSRQAIEFYVTDFLETHAVLDALMYVTLERSSLKSAPDEIILRGIIGILQLVSDREYAPRFEKLERLLGQMRDKNFRGATLAGCKIEPHGNGYLFTREPSAISSKVPYQSGLWDNRFRIKGDLPTDREHYIEPLSDEFWGQARAIWPVLKEKTIPPTVRRGQPVLYAEAGDGSYDLVALPTLGCSGLSYKNVILSPRCTGMTKK